MTLLRFLLAAAAALAPVHCALAAPPVRSVGMMAFTDANTLVVADWRGHRLHALRLPPVAPAEARPFNLANVSSPIAHALHASVEDLRFEDLAFRPEAELAYISLSVNSARGTPTPALVSVDSAGQVSVVDLVGLKRSSVEIADAPSADKRLWRDVPQATYTVTDIVHHEGKLYVAGLSNASFASTLRVFDFPFQGKASSTSVEMYHPVHNELETRAPIRKMTIASLNGEPSLVAAFTCSPLVTIPLKDLKDGAHVVAKTIAELGWGSAPVDMLSFDAGQGPMVLLVNSHKAADLMAVSDIASAAAKPGLRTPIKWPAEPLLGLKSTYIPISGIAQMSDQDHDFLAILRRDEASGAMQLVSLRKGYFLRLSDFVNEYDFADYRYGPGDGFRDVHRVLRTDEGFAELAQRAAR